MSLISTSYSLGSPGAGADDCRGFIVEKKVLTDLEDLGCNEGRVTVGSCVGEA